MTTSSDPEQIRREIERTQAALSQDVDALTEKVTPGKIVERRVDRARDAATRLKEKVMGSDPYGPTGRAGTGRRRPVGRVEGGGPGVRHGVVGRLVGAGRGVVRRRHGPGRGRPPRRTPCRRRRRRSGGRPGATRWPPGSSRSAPAGWCRRCCRPRAASRSSPTRPSRWRRRRCSRSLQQVAGEVGDNLREPAQQAVESVKSTAQDAKDTVADEGRSAAQDVQGRAQDAAGTVRSSTNGS